MQDRFVRSEVDVDGGGYVMFSVGVRECEGTWTTASVTMLLERPGEFHAEHREEEVALDPRGKLPGRGAYVCPNSECLKRARRSRALERALDTAIPESVYEEMEKEMANGG